MSIGICSGGTLIIWLLIVNFNNIFLISNGSGRDFNKCPAIANAYTLAAIDIVLNNDRMKDENQFQILKKEGREAWNQFRIKYPKVDIILNGADFSKAILNRANFDKAELSHANFFETNLEHAYFHLAHLNYSNLCRANLKQADLSEANLSNACLRGADLEDANLEGADFSNADLIGANLVGANLKDTFFKEANLSLAEIPESNLNGVYFYGAVLKCTNLSNSNLRNSDLSSADISNANLSGADLSDADLTCAILNECDFTNSELTGSIIYLAQAKNTNFSNAVIRGGFLHRSNFSNSNFTGAELYKADLSYSTFDNADFTLADLREASLIETSIEQTKFTDCKIYGMSVWKLKGKPAAQKNLIITSYDEPIITVDDIQVAQFIYLLLNNENVRNVIDTVTSKVVLILGRFTEERKAVLNAIRDSLVLMNLTPIICDFAKPLSKDITGTVETLARMARFIIADLTDPSSIPHELASIIPLLRTTPILPIQLEGKEIYGTFKDFYAYNWVLHPYFYKDEQSLISSLAEVIEPANQMAKKIRNEE